MKFNKNFLLGLLFTFAGATIEWFNIRSTPLLHRPPVGYSILGFAVIILGGYYFYLFKKQQQNE